MDPPNTNAVLLTGTNEAGEEIQQSLAQQLADLFLPLISTVSMRATTVLVWPKHHKRLFTAEDVKHLMQDREAIAEDFYKMKDKIQSLLDNQRGPARNRLDLAEVMIELSRLMFEMED